MPFSTRTAAEIVDAKSVAPILLKLAGDSSDDNSSLLADSRAFGVCNFLVGGTGTHLGVARFFQTASGEADSPSAPAES